MKLAVPSESADGLSSARSGHFGHAPYFTIVEIEDGKILGVESVKNVDHDQYGCGGVIQYALGLGIDAMLTVGMGRPPLMAFTSNGIKVYSDRMNPTVEGAVQAFMMGMCFEMSLDDACNHH